MPPPARVGDMCSGHDTHIPHNIISGASTVMIDGVPAAFHGSKTSPHPNTAPPYDVCPGGTVDASAHSAVLVEGNPIALIE